MRPYILMVVVCHHPAFRAYKVQMYFGVLRLSLHSMYGTWSVLDIGFYNCSISFASKATLLCKVY